MDISTLWSVQIDPIWCLVTPSIDWAGGMRMMMKEMMMLRVPDYPFFKMGQRG